MSELSDRERTPGKERHKLVRMGAAPLYAQVASLLRHRIEAGEWREGDCLPPIDRLMDEFSVGRVTVRDAIKRLSADGLLSPQRGRGTLVTGSVARRPLRVEGTLADLIETYRGDRPQVRNLEEGFVRPTLAPDEGRLADDYFHMRRVHLRDGTRYCIISLFIEAGVYAQASDRFREELVLPVLADLGGLTIASGQQSVTIGKCGGADAATLDYPLGDPVALVRRVLRIADGTAIYVADVVYRGDCIRFDMDMKP